MAKGQHGNDPNDGHHAGTVSDGQWGRVGMDAVPSRVHIQRAHCEETQEQSLLPECGLKIIAQLDGKDQGDQVGEYIARGVGVHERQLVETLGMVHQRDIPHGVHGDAADSEQKHAQHAIQNDEAHDSPGELAKPSLGAETQVKDEDRRLDEAHPDCVDVFLPEIHLAGPFQHALSHCVPRGRTFLKSITLCTRRFQICTPYPLGIS